MVGSPFQTPENLADDMLFLEKLDPQMVGIGPFIPHHDTPFADQPAGTLELTLFLLGLIRLLLPKVLLPATTALGDHCPGRQGKRDPRRGECSDAEPFSRTGAGKISALRQQTLHRERNCRELKRPGVPDAGDWLPHRRMPRRLAEHVTAAIV